MDIKTDKFLDQNDGQPFWFKVKSYSIELDKEEILVRYEKQTLSATSDSILKRQSKHYKIKDIAEVRNINEEGEEVIVVEENLEFSKWRNYIGVNQTQEDIFLQNTLLKIMTIHANECVVKL